MARVEEFADFTSRFAPDQCYMSNDPVSYNKSMSRDSDRPIAALNTSQGFPLSDRQSDKLLEDIDSLLNEGWESGESDDISGFYPDHGSQHSESEVIMTSSDAPSPANANANMSQYFLTNVEQTPSPAPVLNDVRNETFDPFSEIETGSHESFVAIEEESGLNI